MSKNVVRSERKENRQQTGNSNERIGVGSVSKTKGRSERNDERQHINVSDSLVHQGTEWSDRRPKEECKRRKTETPSNRLAQATKKATLKTAARIKITYRIPTDELGEQSSRTGKDDPDCGSAWVWHISQYGICTVNGSGAAFGAPSFAYLPGLWREEMLE